MKYHSQMYQLNSAQMRTYFVRAAKKVQKSSWEWQALESTRSKGYFNWMNHMY